MHLDLEEKVDKNVVSGQWIIAMKQSYYMQRRLKKNSRKKLLGKQQRNMVFQRSGLNIVVRVI